jgi:hypothetical protein
MSNIHPKAVFYVNLLADVEVRNKITTVAQCQQFIDDMENEIPHDQLPACYDWIIAHRNRIETREASK